MALEKLRDTWEGILNPVLESLSGVKPSTVTWVALPLGILGGLAVLTAEVITMFFCSEAITTIFC